MLNWGVAPEVWFPVASLALGAILKGVFDALSERRADRRSRLQREEERRESLKLKRLEFQHATLLEFQEVVSRLVRFFGRAHHEDEMNFKKSGEWRRSYLSEDVDNGIAAEQANFARLRVRIRDETARKLAASLSDAALAALVSGSQENARANMSAMTDYLIALNERIGVLLRELEVSEDKLIVVGD